MAYTWDQLHKMTVTRLREIAKGIDDESLRGYSTMHKHELLPALCNVLGIESRAHHEAVGVDKTAIKAQIRALKAKRDAALEAGNPADAKEARHKIKRLKRKVRRSTV
ncbi:MAG: hypothetical protein AMS25_09115 [Gemmatimonas sp. SM23_52]|nr:MAG: hypothetical protein AMS25_09115 [Gemmatimonas sp. SM23_52]